MMKRQQIVILLLLLATPCLWAQKKELSEARTYIKSGKDYDKAEKLMTQLLKADAANRQNPKVMNTWLEAVQGQYEQANEKVYLKQKYDTAAFYQLVKRMYVVAESLDSLDALPDKKGKVKPVYRKQHADMLNQLRPNLYYGGTYNVKKNNYAEAYDFFRIYIDADRQPLFTGYNYRKADPLMSTAAFWATHSGSKMQDAARTLTFSELALKEQSNLHLTMQYICDAYQMQKNDSAYVSMLQKGFERYPENPYFFPRLYDYYMARQYNDSVLVIADKGLAVNPQNKLFLLAKSLALLEMNRYDECIEVSKRLIDVDGQNPEPYFSIASTYLNQALEVEKKNEPRKYHSELQELYTKARPYMEDFRRLAPDDKQRWAPALYRIYFNLNMGKQFEEIDRLMRNH